MQNSTTTSARCYSSGNVLFIILIAVGLFAALSYVVTRSERNTGDTLSKEKLAVQQGRLDTYVANINTAVIRLQFRNCENSEINYTPPESWPSSGDFSCYVFHPKGGGAYYDRALSTGGCLKSQLDELAAGEVCGSVVYVGTRSGKRIYTTLAGFGRMRWSSNRTATGSTSGTDGKTNTDIVVALPGPATYPAFTTCRALGENWYLPSEDELTLFYDSRNIGALAGSFVSTSIGRYWSSTETSADNARMRHFMNGSTQTFTFKDFTAGWHVRCAMQAE